MMTKIKIIEPVDVLMPDMDGVGPDPSNMTVALDPGEYPLIEMTPWGPMIWDSPLDRDGQPTGCNWIVPKSAKWVVVN